MKKFDVIIVGAGIIGLVVANILAKKLNICLIEKGDLAYNNDNGRTVALSKGSYDFLDQNNLIDKSLKKQQINDIRITDNKSSMFLHLSSEELLLNHMGYILEIFDLKKSFLDKLDSNIQVYENYNVNEIIQNDNEVIVNNELCATLLIGADGKFSQVRKLLNIEYQTMNFKQSAIVFNVAHELNHCGVAVEHFYPSGPFAILPLHDGFSSSVVWTEKNHIANKIMSLSEENFYYLLQEKFMDFLGELKIISSVIKYDLSTVKLDNIISDRVALIGDAGHVIHPIAGQGYNLGIKDIKALTDIIIHYHNIGYDIGTKQVLSEYNNNRISDIQSMEFFTENINSLFANNNFLVKTARRLGLKAINNLEFVKKIFVDHAIK